MSAKPTPATIKDVANKAGVSIATVSRVLNRSVPVHMEKAERVRQAMAELRFVPRTAARTLASRKTNTIGLVVPEIAGTFFPHLLKGIEAETRAAGYELLIHSTQNVQPRLLRLLGEHNTDGLLVFTSSMALEELQRLHSIGFPLALMHQTPPQGLNIPVITIENKDGAEMLVSHLIEKHGRRRIVFLRGPQEHEDSYWRERGYREAHEKNYLPVDESLIAEGGFNNEIAFETMKTMLERGLDFDAVFAGDDDSAMGVYRALKLVNRLIPDDVAVVGFDDVQFARYISPPLTTVRAPIEEVGREAVSQLKRLMDGETAESLVLKRTELIIRQSCGCR